MYVGEQEKPISTPKRKNATMETEETAPSAQKWFGLQFCFGKCMDVAVLFLSFLAVSW